MAFFGHFQDIPRHQRHSLFNSQNTKSAAVVTSAEVCKNGGPINFDIEAINLDRVSGYQTWIFAAKKILWKKHFPHKEFCFLILDLPLFCEKYCEFVLHKVFKIWGFPVGF